MPDVVCKCGHYIRAYVPPGTILTCYQCGAEVVFRGNADEDIDESTGSGNQASTPSRSNRKLRSVLKKALAVSAGISCITFCIGAGAFWLWNKETDKVSKQPTLEEAKVESALESKPEAIAQAIWSNKQDWKSSIDEIPQGPKIQQFSKEIAGQASIALNSAVLERLDTSAIAKSLPEFTPVKLQDFLKKSAVDSFETPKDVVCSDWSVLAFHVGQNEIGVLVRYFQEPLVTDVNQSGLWINGCQSILSFEDFASKTPGLFDPPEAVVEPAKQSPDHGNQDAEAPNHFLTPAFGYLILLFDIRSDGIAWKDLIPLPGEIPLSRALAPNTTQTKRFVDIFGEYRADADYPLSSLVYDTKGAESSNLPTQLRRTVASISELRSRRLAEIAEAATVDASLLDAKMARFRKEFPNDIGADVLLTSIWCKNQSKKRSTDSYDEVGRIYIDAAHRLYMKTSDPLLQEIKSRIYQSYGRRQEAEKSLAELEKANSKSLSLLERRIAQAIESNDKAKLMDYLDQLTQLLREKPKSWINPRIQAEWNKRFAQWKSENQSK